MDCIAVINRPHPSYQFDAAETYEASSFSTMQQRYLKKHPSVSIEVIWNRCGIDKLISRMHRRFLSFAKESWQKDTLQDLTQTASLARNDLAILGLAPEHIQGCTDKLLMQASAQVCTSVLITSMLCRYSIIICNHVILGFKGVILGLALPSCQTLLCVIPNVIAEAR